MDENYLLSNGLGLPLSNNGGFNYDKSRLGDFGTARLLRQDLSGEGKISRMTRPMGTIGYMDPEFFKTQKLTPQSDIYSFGIIILQLLTGWEELSIMYKVEEKLENEGTQRILDDTAGNWPVLQAEQFLRLALRCCAEPKERPNLTSNEWRVLEVLQAIAGKSRKTSKLQSKTKEDSTCTATHKS